MESRRSLDAPMLVVIPPMSMSVEAGSGAIQELMMMKLDNQTSRSLSQRSLERYSVLSSVRHHSVVTGALLALGIPDALLNRCVETGRGREPMRVAASVEAAGALAYRSGTSPIRGDRRPPGAWHPRCRR